MAGIEAGGNAGVVSENGAQEKIGKARVEIRLADLNRDAVGIAELFHQPSILEHLSGIAPSEYTAATWNKKFEDVGKKIKIIAATTKGVEDLYGFYNDNGIDSDKILLVAENSKKQIAGTVAVVRYTDPGLTYSIISQLDVDQSQRRRGIGEKLLRTANALIFLPRELGGLGEEGAETGVIGVSGGGFVGDMFKGEGYRSIGTQLNFCVSWDRRAREFRYRNSDRFQIHSNEFLQMLKDKKINISDLRKLLPRH